MTVGCRKATWVFASTGCMMGPLSCIVANILDKGGELTEETDVPLFLFPDFYLHFFFKISFFLLIKVFTVLGLCNVFTEKSHKINLASSPTLAKR